MGSIDLALRAEATRRTMEAFRHRPFDWASGATCLHLARAQMVNMGHSPPPIPPLRSAVGALRALRRRGYDSVSALLDSLLPRVAPARMLVGDLAIIEGDERMECIVVSAGGKMLGWHQDGEGGMQNLIVTHFLAAWRL